MDRKSLGEADLTIHTGGRISMTHSVFKALHVDELIRALRHGKDTRKLSRRQRRINNGRIKG